MFSSYNKLPWETFFCERKTAQFRCVTQLVAVIERQPATTHFCFDENKDKMHKYKHLPSFLLNQNLLKQKSDKKSKSKSMYLTEQFRWVTQLVAVIERQPATTH